MKLEHLAYGSPECPLIRLYDFTLAEAGHFLAVLVGLASGTIDRVDIHELPFVEQVGDCRLTFVGRSWDQAVIAKSSPGEFECGFTAGTWDNVAGLVEPFAMSAHGFQWLAGSPGEAALLLSVSGGW